MSQLDQLTKKNQEFIHIATKQLIADGKTDSEIKAILEEALPSILERQKAGETARHFLGAPTAWAARFSQPEPSQAPAAAEKNTNPYLMWLDTTFLFLGMVSLINALMALFSPEQSETRLISLFALAMVGGLAMYLTYHHIYRHLGKEKAERPSLLRSILIMSAVLATWVLLVGATSLLPTSINIALPLYALVLIGAAAFGGRYYLQKKYNVQNALSPRPQ